MISVRRKARPQRRTQNTRYIGEEDGSYVLRYSLRPVTNHGIAFSLRALHRFSGRCIVGCEGKGSGIFAMSRGRVATIRQELAQLDVNFECRGVVGFGGGGEIGAQESLGELRGA